MAGIVVPNLGELSVLSVLNRKVVLSLLPRSLVPIHVPEGFSFPSSTTSARNTYVSTAIVGWGSNVAITWFFARVFG